MTRKHFEIIAKNFAYNQAFGWGFNEEARGIISRAFRDCNPNFDPVRFWNKVDKLADDINEDRV